MVVKKHQKLERILTLLLIITLLGSIVFTIVRVVNAPVIPDDSSDKGKSDYILMLLQCALGLFVVLLPSIIERRLNLEIPSVMTILFMLFLYGAIYLGEVHDFYYIIPNWDIILHAFSGFMLGCLSFSFITLLNKWERIPIHLSPIFVAIFAFCFTVTLGVFWEIYEFSFDGILGLNMQKFILEDGTVLLGREAIRDTMEDLMVDCLGGLAASIVGYISLKYNKGWIEKLQIRKKKTDSLSK